ncbi:WD40 domain-containing protein [Thalassoroseus pseudoceratinae]|uniref:WD40 domain-containing protein n=1 Tax=Thalassoroseus pseudoceratinae TaxID=2713176 RepID=UPI0014208C0B|nr:c-type cytochrome domain-containing protein [Thalassoroseus pseudoceratinae]
MFARRTVLLTALLSFVASGVVADELPLSTLKKAAAESKTKRDKAKSNLDEAEASVQKATEDLLRAKSIPRQADRTLSETEKSLKAQEEAIKKAAEAVQKAELAKQKADQVVKDAGEDAAKKTAAEKQQAATTAELKKQQELLETANKSLQEIRTKRTAAEQAKKDAPQKIENAETALKKARQDRDERQKAYETIAAAWLADQQAVESHLIEHDQLVSFSEKVAPIFHRRCVACHNARQAQGRLNMETFAAMAKGGESGESFVAGDPDSSMLWTMIEIGEMPKDADPLTADEMAVIRRWIETGAVLDAGKPADASLLTIMPKPEQPQPPESYAATIPVTALAYSPDGKLLASSGYHEVLLWNAEDGSLVRRISNLAERVYDVQFSQDGATIVVAAGTPAQIGEVKQFAVADGQLLADLMITPDSVFAIALSPDGTRLASAGADRSVRVFDLESQAELLHVEDHADWVMDVAWSPDGKQLVSASRDKTAKVVNAETGEAVITFNSHSDAVYAVAFSQDGKQVVSAGEDRQIRLWKVADAKAVKTVRASGAVFDLEQLPNGQTATAEASKTARLVAWPKGQIAKTFSGSPEWLYSVAASPSTQRIAAGSYDGTIRIWNMEDGKEFLKFVAKP